MSEDIPQPRSQSVAHWAVNERLNHIQYILLLKAEKEHSFETFPSKEMKLKYWRLKGSPLGKMTAYLTLNSSPIAQFAGCFFLTLVLFFGLIHTLDSIFPVYLKALLKTCFSPCLRPGSRRRGGGSEPSRAVCRGLGSLALLCDSKGFSCHFWKKELISVPKCLQRVYQVTQVDLENTMISSIKS